MNAEYFDKQIHEELAGAKDYIMRAIEIRPMHAPWSKELVEMSSAELTHATKLYRMFQEYYAKFKETYQEIPEYIQKTYDCVSKDFMNCSAEIKMMHQAYNT